jgi:hypothetical protein
MIFEVKGRQMRTLRQALARTFSDFIYIFLGISIAANYLALDYILLTQTTSFRIMAAQNIALFNGAQLTLSILTALLLGISTAMLVYIFRQARADGAAATPGTVSGTIVAAIASGCPVCGAWLLPLLGIAGSLAVFPLQGLEIRLLAVGLLIYSILRSSNVILGICVPGHRFRRFATNMAVASLAIAALYLLPYTPDQFKLKFQQAGISAPTEEQILFTKRLGALGDQVNPPEGFTINARFGNIGYQLVEAGVINFEKFTALYARAGTPLTPDQLQIFDEAGLNRQITINRDNAYFLLNLFWAFGLANENPILTEGKITTYGKARIGDFASTGGWTIADRPLEAIFAKSRLAPLNDQQQAMLLRVARNVYRPCCGNSTAFPDCNHGMALLGVLELLAANGASEDALYRAAKYFSAFWFPDQAYDVATYFMAVENRDFADIDPQIVVSRQYFSGPGWSQVKGWLEANIGPTGQSTPQGGGCGV